MRILLVDDDEDLMESLAERLIQQRYAVDIAVDGSSAKTYVELFDYDLIMLDLMLPDGDGIEFCRAFRAEGYINPLMILTAKESTAQKVKALDAGADDYVIKPFNFDELCARIRALLRREHQGLPTVLALGPLRLDPSACETTYKSNPIRLTPKEFSMMELFLRHPHRVYSLSAIIDDLWSFEDPPGEDAVRTHIKGLRRKLKGAGAPKDLIKTVYGLGYRLNENTAGEPEVQLAQKVSEQKVSEQKVSEQKVRANSKTVASASAERQQSSEKQFAKKIEQQISEKQYPKQVSVMDDLAHQAKLSEQLVQACRRYLSTASRQVAILEKVASVLPDALSAASAARLFFEGRICAHKLAGSLGSFGIAEGSQIARNIEVFLEEKVREERVREEKIKEKKVREERIREKANAEERRKIEKSLSPVLVEQFTQFTQWVVALRSLIDRATVQAATDALAASVQEGLPVVLIVSKDTLLAQSLAECAPQVNLRTQVVATLSQAIAVLALADCNLILIDMSTADSAADSAADSVDGDELLTFSQEIKQRYALPIVVLSERLTLDQRLDLIQQGIEIVTHRSALPLQIMTAAAGVIRAQVSEIRVAIADDDPDILSLLQTSLEPWGFQVTTFTRATHLWEWLANDPELPNPADESALPKADILVLDVEMPEMSGLDLCQILRADARFQSIPILFLTHHQEETLRMQAYQLGADDFIHKAIAPTEIATRLRNQLTRSCVTGQIA